MNFNAKGYVGANTARIGRLLGTGTVTVNAASGTGNILEINSTNEPSVFSGRITGNLKLVKNGAATLTLDGANTYSQHTTVNAGLLEVNGSIEGHVVMENGSTLGGTGSVADYVQAKNDSTLSAGSSIGELTTGLQQWDGGLSLEVEINDAAGRAGGSNGWDLLSSTSQIYLNLSSASPCTIHLSGQGGSVVNYDNRHSYAWPIATGISPVGGSFSADHFVIDASAFTTNNPLVQGRFSVSTSGGSLYLNFTPSAYSSWKLANGIAPEVAADSDLDGNGLPLLGEYGFDVVPGAPWTNNVPSITINGDDYEYHFNRARSELFYDVLTRTNLLSGSWQVLSTNPGSAGGEVNCSEAMESLGPNVYFTARIRFD